MTRPSPRPFAAFRFRRMAPAAVLFALALAAGCARDDAGAVRASGQVEATEVRLAAKVRGVVERVTVEEGDPVTRGQVVAVLDTVDLVLAVREAAAARAQAAAQAALLEAGTRAEDLAAARAEVAFRRSDYEGAERDHARIEALYRAQAVPAQARDDARRRRDMAQAALRQAQAGAERATRGARPEERAAVRAALAQADAALAAAEQQRRDATVIAPLDGVVAEKLVEPGELVTPGDGLLVVTDLAHPWLTAFVTGEDLPRIRIGATATVKPDAAGEPGRPGRVTAISPTAEFTPRNVQTRDERARLVYRVRIRIDNADGRFKPGMPADAVIATVPAPSAPRAGR
jgi:HlyD family secretion protein